MGKIFELTSDIKQIVTDALDDLLIAGTDGGLGKKCLLVYPPRYVRCDNCVIDPSSGKSTGRYRHGGPMPFDSSRCPVCQGEGRQASTDVTEEIVFGCNWNPKKFVTPISSLNLRVPDSLLETKGYLKDLPKVLKADHLVAQLPLAPLVRQKFKLVGEPGDRSNIIQDRYFHAVWERWNG